MMDNVREILLAAESGNVSKIREYISSGRINVVDEEGSSPLMYAAANGAEKIVRLVLQSDVSVNQQNHYGWTALLQASCYGHHEVVYTLLQSNANINLCNNWGATPLVAAAQGGFTTVVQVLLEKNATVTTADEVFSITPLMAAAQCGNETIIKLLLDHQSNPNTRYAPIGWTALMFAALNNHAPVITELLRRGAVREMRDVNNQRAIDLASSSGLTDVVSMLSEDETVAPSSDIDIFQAVKQVNMSMLTEVIKKHKVSVTVTDKDGATPLMYAARKGNVEACQILLDHGADFDAQDQIHRWTAFMHAVHHGHYGVAKLLAQYGANVNLRAKNGSSAFDIANLIGDARTIHLIAEITIQRLTEKKANSTPSVSAIGEETEIPIRSPSLSPQPPGDDEAVNILRRVSNAYLASGDMPSHLDLVRSGSHSPYAHKSPSPDPSSIDDICLPAITKPTPSFLRNNKLSPSPPDIISPPNIISPPALLKVPQRQNSGKRKGTQSSTKDGVHSYKVQQPPFPNSSPSVKKPNFHLPLSPFTDNNKSVSGFCPSRNKDLPQIKSPRSLPTETFNFLKNKGPPNAGSPKGSQFLRSSSKYKLPPNFSSSAEKPNKSNGGGWANNMHSADLKLGEKSRVPSSVRITSFDKIKLPVAHKGQDLKTILGNASLGQYYSVFEEEEIVDISSFSTLSDKDLIELGITDSNGRKKVISLISQLKESPHPKSPLTPKPPLSAGSFRFH